MRKTHHLLNFLAASPQATEHPPSIQSGMRYPTARSSTVSYRLTSESWHGVQLHPSTSPPASPAKNATTNTSSPSPPSHQHPALQVCLVSQASQAHQPDAGEKAGSTLTPCVQRPANSSAFTISETSARLTRASKSTISNDESSTRTLKNLTISKAPSATLAALASGSMSSRMKLPATSHMMTTTQVNPPLQPSTPSPSTAAPSSGTKSATWPQSSSSSARASNPHL